MEQGNLQLNGTEKRGMRRPEWNRLITPPEKILFAMMLFTMSFAIIWRTGYIEGSDYYIHGQWASDFISRFPLHQSYPLWHFCVFIVYKILGGSERALHFACAAVSAAVHVLIFLITDDVLKDKKHSAAISFCLSVTTAIFVPWYNMKIYYGQGSPVTWHNPTNLMVKPFAILAFFLVVKLLNQIKVGTRISKKDYAALGILVTLSVLAKPSFFQGFVPALGIYMLLVLFQNRFRPLGPCLIICAMFVPAAAVIAGQFVLSFYSGGSGNGIGIGWLVASGAPNVWISLLLVLCFPLSYLLTTWRTSIRKTDVQLAWLFWLTSWLEGALLYEKGERMMHGNFGWAVLLSYTILFLVSAKEYFGGTYTDTADRKSRAVRVIPGAAFAMHVISGWIYAAELITGLGAWWF